MRLTISLNCTCSWYSAVNIFCRNYKAIIFFIWFLNILSIVIYILRIINSFAAKLTFFPYIPGAKLFLGFVRVWTPLSWLSFTYLQKFKISKIVETNYRNKIIISKHGQYVLKTIKNMNMMYMIAIGFIIYFSTQCKYLN